MARPKAKLDWNEIGEMLKCGCDATSIAASLGISTDTLYVRSKSDLNTDFSAFSQQKKAQGAEMLRRKQFDVAMEGDRTMLIWLGKNRLGQTEKQEITHTIELDRLKQSLATAAERMAELQMPPEQIKHNILLFLPLNPNAQTLSSEQQRQLVGEVVDKAVIETVEVADGEYVSEDDDASS